MKNLQKRWITANILSFTGGSILHAITAHGLTGGHEFWMTLPQFVMHNLGFLTLGLSISLAQRSALKPFVEIKFSNVLLKAVLFVIGFWAGYFSLGIPVDIIIGFAVLGVFSGLELRGKIPDWKRWMKASAIGFTLASFIAIAPLILIHKKLTAMLGNGLIGDLAIWTIIGIFGGISAGLLTAPFLAKSLEPETNKVADLALI